MTGKVYLLPTYLYPGQLGNVPGETKSMTTVLKYLIVENIRTSRRYLKQLDSKIDIDSIVFFELDKHHAVTDIDIFLQPALSVDDIGILSEAGCPGIADPGQAIIARAHKLNLKVVPLTGPSSVFLALMASGMNGQKFTFHGYLPIDDGKKRKFIRYMEKEAMQRNETQIFMETPYRNNKLIQTLLNILDEKTRLSLAANISGKNEFIYTKTVGEWREQTPDLHKQPTIFLIL